MSAAIRFIETMKTTIVLFLTVVSVVSVRCAEPDMRVITTANAVLRFARESGDLVGITWKDPELDVIREPRLGENFRILLPKTGHETCYFNSRDQKVNSIEETSDG